MILHQSHEIQENSYNIECRNCWGCSCHSPDILEKPCDRSVEIETNSPHIVESVERQSALYGEQIRQLENGGLSEDSSRVLLAWIAFRNAFRAQLNGIYFLRMARLAYAKAYWNSHDQLYLRQIGDPT